MTGKSADQGPRTVPETLPGQPRLAAALAEHLAEINRRNGLVAQLLAEIALTPVAAASVADGPERMWTPQQIADASGVAYRTVLGWIRAGDLKAMPVGEHYRVPDSEWQQFIREHIRAAAALHAA